MTKKDKLVLIDGLKKLSQDIADIAAVLEGAGSAQAKEQDAAAEIAAPEPEQAKEPQKVYTYEEVRGILAEKSRTGFRAEVKALLTAHGYKQLSDITDPDVFAALVAEAEVIGSA